MTISAFRATAAAAVAAAGDRRGGGTDRGSRREESPGIRIEGALALARYALARFAIR